MPKVVPEIIQFCGGCGVQLPITEERTLSSRTPEDEHDPDKQIFKCDNCGNENDKNLDITGYFSPDDAAKLRCL